MRRECREEWQTWVRKSCTCFIIALHFPWHMQHSVFFLCVWMCDALSPNTSNSLRRANEVERSVCSPQVEQVGSFSAKSLFLFAQDVHVTLRSTTLMVNTHDCTDTVRIKEDGNEHQHEKRTSARHTALCNQRHVGQVGSLVISKKKSLIPRLLTRFFWKPPCLKKTDTLWKMDQICFMSDGGQRFPRVNLS